MNDDVEFAIVSYMKKSARPAFIAAQGVITLESEENTRTNASDTDKAVIRRMFIDSENAHEILSYSKSQSGFWLMG